MNPTLNPSLTRGHLNVFNTYLLKNQENLIPRFPSQAARASSITVKITGIVELSLNNLKSVFLDSPTPYTLITKNR
ncbi:MAG: hypothetical protein EWV75_02295 [Microcystis wesenbergii Mw_QC_S_20081001_S30D]|uniref:Uncharacterized protein n=2 Tax=Microcystis wesenbergii TaxID=44823 RepID=A0A552LRM6_9CHRO|nr:MAG: hypothetical protein DWQ58_16625 [Microcystis aeruginosa TA09]TRV00463.1 MAG: hypothetical protein EWV74_12235 [Microcystis wesenbergii Mw_QC_S_20081001_S30]TRV00869.1 MAG: hypothetical protein EWV75_02295 [Microcystis wesenbergii Mw_QC_S_20081001_S30D]TRV01892.1 MAG: hypothetical protein EWV73_08535 [Microcystis wesenbergii Mw_QC_B_20070930_S4D]TRV08851.1 MAG: hypothetical protein EWV41_09710 [Microcystis wesenbergii Mw_MB_S_20031200_S109]TRV17061.1 MAG: hypothetical protein EWV89_036